MKNYKVQFLKLLAEWKELGQLPSFGLCSAIPYEGKGIFDIFTPTPEDKEELESEGIPTMYWAAGRGRDHDNDTWEDRFMGLTPLRETILCFCAVLNKEV